MKRKIAGFLAILCAISLIGLCLYLGLKRKHTPPGIKSSAVSTRVKTLSGGAAQMTYRGSITFSDGSIPVFDKKAFTLTFHARVMAKVDFGKAEIRPEGDTLFVTLPKPEIASVTVDDKTLSFSGNTYALLNWMKKKDVTRAITSAKNAALKSAEASTLKDAARKSAQENARELLKPLKTPEGKSYKIRFS